MLKIVHVIERFISGGPDRTILSLAKHAARAGRRQQHTICALERSASPLTQVQARRLGLTVLRAPETATLREQLASADIVMAHFWNNPVLVEFLRGEWPAMRLVAWLAVLGLDAPHVLTRELLDFSDAVVATSPGTLELPVVRANPPAVARAILSNGDFDRLNGFARRPHQGFNVGYIGTVTFAKLHPQFVPMSAAARIPDARFIVCGGGDAAPLREQARALGAEHRFEFRGYVENIRAALEEFDVFGYPLCADTSATGEIALQEAMWVGVPPVVLPHGGLRHLVQHGETGLVAQSADDYTRCLAYLARTPEERVRLGANAREYARHAFQPGRAAERFGELFDVLMQQPKRTRRWPDWGDRPAEWLVRSYGDQGAPFARSLQGGPAALVEQAEERIAAASPALFAGEGGIVHYRNRYPRDPHLRLWTGLCLQRQGDHARAEIEFRAAVELGLACGRVKAYLGAARPASA